MITDEMTSDEYRLWQVTQYDEKTWQQWVVREAAGQGYEVYHTHDSRRSNPGYPDLTLAHAEHGVVFLELKTETGRVRRDQKRWLATLQASGQRAFVVRPRDVDALCRLLAGQDVWIGPRFSLPQE